ncbi:hypothetical protein N9D11_03655 [Candidatus Pelagibacter sp.]|jgi:hypothetical protein|nr:hypothetical protein [Candidatus Pelagibacter sp.]MDA9890182.1 hypothetical protein [Candidatus Pelagibacter sp.]|tara:strand:+ start:1049 stop:1324 length:276 start_codon:yes stop_codon:yes gene_type:complete
MNFEDIKNKFLKLINSDHSNKTKIYLTISLSWIIFIGYLTWWNGLKGLALDKSFKWDEWFWFGIVPALSPYLFQYIWKDKKKTSNTNHFKE